MQQLITIIIFFSILCLLIKWRSNSTRRNKRSSPPSPPKLPILGNILQLGYFPHRTLQSMAQKYGPLMLIHLGRVPVLVISSADAAREIMKTHDRIFANRPQNKMFGILLYNFKDVASAPYGEYWRQVRSICMLHLLSVNKVRSLCAVREEETTVLMDKIRVYACSSLPVNLSELLPLITNDIICRVTMGRKYGGKEFRELLRDFTELLGTFVVGDYVPCLDWCTRVSGLYARARRVAQQFDEFLDRVVEEHMCRHKEDVSLENEQGHRDFVDVLLWVQRTNTTGFSIHKSAIKAIILDMFAGGTDTTFTLLEWAMTEVLRHPNVMKKVQDEARNVVGERKHISEEDLVDMQYLKAVIKETLRLHPPIPLLVPRESMQDVEVQGYHIAGGTQVIVNAWAIARDPTNWEQPEEFKPERFMNSSIDVKGNDLELIPFGSGRRGCPGSIFALSVAHLVLANLLHQFHWSLPPPLTTLDISQTVGLTMHRKNPLVAIPTISK